ncbi:MAG TPA: hypothetical protein VK204_02705 [Nocardioidaceae bacterium]|nr:hypothetical protein [Nocardioidaceae bacterium]
MRITRATTEPTIGTTTRPGIMRTTAGITRHVTMPTTAATTELTIGTTDVGTTPTTVGTTAASECTLVGTVPAITGLGDDTGLPKLCRPGDQ